MSVSDCKWDWFVPTINVAFLGEWLILHLPVPFAGSVFSFPLKDRRCIGSQVSHIHLFAWSYFCKYVLILFFNCNEWIRVLAKVIWLGAVGTPVVTLCLLGTNVFLLRFGAKLSLVGDHGDNYRGASKTVLTSYRLSHNWAFWASISIGWIV